MPSYSLIRQSFDLNWWHPMFVLCGSACCLCI